MNNESEELHDAEKAQRPEAPGARMEAEDGVSSDS